MTKDFSICTPVYNRAHLLERVYTSLLANRSTKYTFEWLLVDDGSDIDLEKLNDFVNRVKKENLIDFKFFSKSNGGKHTCLNKFFEEARGELLLILDSDDALVSGALERVHYLWMEAKGEDCAGIIGHCIDIENGTRLGDDFPSSPMRSTILNNNINLKLSGDRCDFVRTDLLRNKRFPIYENERFMPEAVIMVLPEVSRYYLCVNEDFKLVEYQDGGLSDSYLSLTINNPRGMQLRFKVVIDEPKLLDKLLFLGKLKYFTNFYKYSYYSGGVSELLSNFSSYCYKGGGVGVLGFFASILLIVREKIS